jgi:hypothetical protein
VPQALSEQSRASLKDQIQKAEQQKIPELAKAFLNDKKEAIQEKYKADKAEQARKEAEDAFA